MVCWWGIVCMVCWWGIVCDVSCCCVLEYELQHVAECHAASEETNNELKGATCLLFLFT